MIGDQVTDHEKAKLNPMPCRICGTIPRQSEVRDVSGEIVCARCADLDAGTLPARLLAAKCRGYPEHAFVAARRSADFVIKRVKRAFERGGLPAALKEVEWCSENLCYAVIRKNIPMSDAEPKSALLVIRTPGVETDILLGGSGPLYSGGSELTMQEKP